MVKRGLTSQRRKSFKLVIPGHGDPVRSPSLNRSIALFRTSQSPDIDFSCEIFVFTEEVVDLVSRTGCTIHKGPGLWTDYMKRVHTDTDYVGIMMDDVFPGGVHLTSFLRTMEQHRLGAAAAALASNWTWTVMEQDECCLLRRTNYTDTLFSVFTREAFDCWARNIDLELNHLGWGYDVSFTTLCGVSLAVLDSQVAHHTTSASSRTYSTDMATEQLWAWLRFSMHWDIKTNASGFQQLEANNNQPTKCERAPVLFLVNPGYSTNVDHRGGWRVVIRHAIEHGAISGNSLRLDQALAREPRTTTGCVDQLGFIDCCEHQFLFENLIVTGKWLGVIHYSFDLPESWPRFETLQALLECPAFKTSLSGCQGLIVLSNHVARWLRTQLPSIFITVLKHPIGIDGVVPRYQLQAFLDNPEKKVVFLGSQFRRVSTIALLTTPYPKIWLHGRPGRTAKDYELLYRRDPDAPLPMPVIDFNLDYVSPDAFDDHVLHNIVVVDLFDASANNAVLEAIAMYNPIFISYHPAVVEYLGEGYPLYFHSRLQLENMLGDEGNLVKLLAVGHDYLKIMPKDDLQTEHFSQELKVRVALVEKEIRRERERERER